MCVCLSALYVQLNVSSDDSDAYLPWINMPIRQLKQTKRITAADVDAADGDADGDENLVCTSTFARKHCTQKKR